MVLLSMGRKMVLNYLAVKSITLFTILKGIIMAGSFLYSEGN